MGFEAQIEALRCAIYQTRGTGGMVRDGKGVA